MAQRDIAVFLGYEDEEIVNEKHRGLVNFTTNKIGGKPDFPSNATVETPICPLCQLPELLIVQIYAPLENDTFHRTLYLFACINPVCWNQNESWSCIRIQTMESSSDSLLPKSQASMVTDWCQDADNWDDENNANMNEENGNLVGAKVSDEEDESYSFEESASFGFGNLCIDDRNANTGGLSEAQGGAVGRQHSPLASAEIEGDEGEVISVDTPTFPQNDIVKLLEERTPLPKDLTSKSSLQFDSYFLNVYEEDKGSPLTSDPHIRELLQEYQRNNEGDLAFCQDRKQAVETRSDHEDNATIEKYEEDCPIHGDKMFYYFKCKLQRNPGQLLRYSREHSRPLLLYPLQDSPRKCQYCQGDVVFEFQVLPTLIPKLRLSSSDEDFASSRLEFGNVLVFACKKSCWSSETSFRSEAVIVQKEIY